MLHARARKHDPEKLKDTIKSMKDRGQLEPARGRPVGDSIEVYIGAGRYAGAQALNWDSLWVVIGDRSDEDVDLDMLHENLKREDLDPLAVAREYDYNMKAHHWTQDQMADKAGVTQKTVSGSLSLLLLSDELQESIRQGIISKTHGIIIAKLNDPSGEKELAKAIEEKRLTVESAEKAAELFRDKGLEAMQAFLTTGSKGKGHKVQGLAPQERGKPSHLWPGLPEGVLFKSHGGMHSLAWNASRYSKELIQTIAASAPDKIQGAKENKAVKMDLVGAAQ